MPFRALEFYFDALIKMFLLWKTDESQCERISVLLTRALGLYQIAHTDRVYMQTENTPLLRFQCVLFALHQIAITSRKPNVNIIIHSKNNHSYPKKNIVILIKSIIIAFLQLNKTQFQFKYQFSEKRIINFEHCVTTEQPTDMTRISATNKALFKLCIHY